MKKIKRVLCLMLCTMVILTQITGSAFAMGSVGDAAGVVEENAVPADITRPVEEIQGESAETADKEPGGDVNGEGNQEAPDVSQPDMSQPDVSQPDMSQPDVSQPDVSQPDVSQPDGDQPDVSQPAENKADVPFGETIVNFLKDNILLFSMMNTKWYKEGETEFTLTNSRELRGLAELVNDTAAPVDFSGVTIYLGKDISLSDGTWMPIGSSASCPFSGSFDGKGHTISGMEITGESNNRGLFGYTDGGEIRDLLLEGTVKGGEHVGGLIGYAHNTSVLNCGVNAEVTASGNASAGIIGKADAGCTVENSYSMGNLHGAEAAISETAEIKNCYYLEGTAAGSADASIEKTKDAFASGEAAYLLDGGGTRERLNVWTQGADSPSFATQNSRPVYRLTAQSEQTDHGSAEAPEYVKAGAAIPFTMKAEEGYLLKKAAVEYADGKTIADSGSAPNILMAESDGSWFAEFAPIPQEKEFTVTLHGNGGTVDGSARKEYTVKAGEKLAEQIPQWAEAVREAYGFQGWYSDPELTKPYLFGEAVVENLELYAKWKDRFTTGTKERPFEIKSAALLAELAKRTAEGNGYEDCYFILTEDIQLKGEWTPIGTAEHPFSGSLDGAGHRIAGLQINNSALDHQGLFGATKGAVIKNLILQGSITAGDSAGALIGSAENTAVAYCGSEAAVNGVNGKAGALIGLSDSSTSVKNCFAIGKIEGKTGADFAGDAKTSNCYFVKGNMPESAKTDGVVSMEAEAFQLGEAAYLLDGGGTANRAKKWSQGKDAPVFADESNRPVYRIIVKNTDKGKLLPDREYLRAGEKAVLTSEPGVNGVITYVLRLATVMAGTETLCADSGSVLSFTMPDKDVTAQGQFVEKTADQFTVTFDANGGSFLIRSPYKEVEVNAGEKLSPESVRKPLNSSRDYRFTGWYVDKQCNREYNFNLGVTEDFTLYAGWSSKDSVKVLFNLNGGQGTIPPQTVLQGGKIARPEEPVRAGEEGRHYRFLGWFAQEEGGEAWDFDKGTVPDTENEPEFTLFAHWGTVGAFESGTEEMPFLIDSAECLKELGQTVNQGKSMSGCYFALAADIDLSGYRNWVPIGSEANPFSGSLDGRGRTISGLKINKALELSGLFGKVKEGTIKNLTVNGTVREGQNAGGIAAKAEEAVFISCVSAVTVSGDTAGGILGVDEKNSVFTDCANTGAIAGGSGAGGIAGKAENALGNDRAATKFIQCQNSGAVRGGTGRAGGIFGYGELNYKTSVIFQDCLNTGAVSGGDGTGGVAGGLFAADANSWLDSSKITNCENRGNIAGEEAVGGLIGRTDGLEGVKGAAPVEIEQCINKGAVSGVKYAGGLGGLLRSLGSKSKSTISDSCNWGTVTASGEQAGGIIGSNETPYKVTAEKISGVYNGGAVAAPLNAGNIIGTANINPSNYSNCCGLEGAVTKPVDGEAASLKSPAEMKSAAFAYQMDGGDGARKGIWTKGNPGPTFADNENRPVYRLEIGNLDGGAVSGLAAGGYYEGGSTVFLSSQPAEGKVLKYYTVTDGTGKVLLTDSGKVSFPMPESNAVFAAQFVEKTAESFQVTFHGNGGLMGELLEKTVTVAAGEKAGEPSIHKKTEDGVSYLMQGWYTDEACTALYNFNIGVTENLELYALWRVNSAFTVNYDLNTLDSTAVGKPDSVETYRGKKLLRPEEPVWADREDETHRFLGWAQVKEASPEQCWNFETDTISPFFEGDSMTLYAQWEVSDLFLTGSETAPFPIADTTTLAYLAKKVNWGKTYEDCYFRLTGDLYELGEAWTPIGTEETPFCGSFDGGGKTVSGLSFIPDIEYNGLFGYVKGALIHDLTVSGSDTVSVKGGKGTGGIVGGAADATVIRDCTNEVPLSTGTGPIGGILGTAISAPEDEAGVTIEGCRNTVSIQGSSKGYVGGIAGQAGSFARLSGCENTGAIKSSGSYTGGIIGKASANLICLKNCVNSGAVSAGSSSYTGGIAGYLASAKYAGTDLSGCTNSGTIQGGNYTGGLFGYVANSFYHAISCEFNQGDVISKGMYAGGIAAYVERGTVVSHCMNSGNVTTSSKAAKIYVSGILGEIGKKFTTSSTELQSAWVENCLNTGSVTTGKGSGAGAIMGIYFEKNKGNYSMEGKVNEPVDAAYVTQADSRQLAGGEVAYQLNQSSSSGRVALWGQKGSLPHLAGGAVRPVYKMTIKPSANGQVEQEKIYPSEAETVSLAIEPENGYLLKLLTVTELDETRCKVKITDNQAVFQMPDGDVEVDAVFVQKVDKNITITFDAKGGTPVDSIKTKAGKRINAPADPVRGDYDFIGWYLDGELFDFNTAVMENITLTAQWKKSGDAIVTFRLNHPVEGAGSSVPEPQIVKKGKKAVQPETPRWEGADGTNYRFTGWFTEKTGGRQWNFETDTVEGDVTLHAQWEGTDLFLTGTTENNPAVIEAAVTLQRLASKVNQGITYEGYYFKLGKDIDLNELPEAWDSIGFHIHINALQRLPESPAKGSLIFEGNFNGDGHTVTLKSDQIRPLFGCIGKSGTVTNLMVKGVMKANPKRLSFGGVVGYNFGQVSDCHVDIDSVDGGKEPGFGQGAAGIASGNAGLVEDCTARLTMYADHGAQTYMGGIVALQKYGTVKNCTLKSGSKLTVSSSKQRMAFSGGIVGAVASWTGNEDHVGIINCTTESGSVLTCVKGEYFAGIAGQAQGIMTGCVNNADIVNTDGGAAGVIGQNMGGIEQCANTGTIQAVGNACGLAESGAMTGAYSINNCYNTGDIISEGKTAYGITSIASGTIANTYSWGKLKGIKRIGIAPSSNNTSGNNPQEQQVVNTYFAMGDGDEDVVIAPNVTIVKELVKFTDGEIAYRLDGGDKERQNVWAQGEKYPVLGQPGSFKVTTEVTGRTEGGEVYTDPDAEYIRGGTKVSVSVKVNTPKNVKGEEKKYVYTLTAIKGDGRTDITDSKSFIADQNTHVVARFELEEELYQEEPEEKPDDGGNHGGGDGSGSGTGQGDGNGAGNGQGTAGTEVGKGEGSGVAPGNQTGTGSSAETSQTGSHNGSNANQLTAVNRNEEQTAREQIPQEQTQGEDQKTLEAANSGGLEAGGTSEDKEKDKITVFEIIKKAAADNPLIAFVIAAGVLGILLAGGIRRYRKEKNK